MTKKHKCDDRRSAMWDNITSIVTNKQSWKNLSKIYKNTCDENEMNE
jgi:hypothetical protein